MDITDFTEDNIQYLNNVEKHGFNNQFFKDKKWNYITDMTSNSGSFSGQFQFNLNTLSSMGEYVNLKEAVIQFPLKLTAQLTTAATSSGGSVTGAQCFSNFIVPKSFYDFIDGVSLVINGITLTQLGRFNNVPAHFKILTEWSKDTLKKDGPLTCTYPNYIRQKETIDATQNSLFNQTKTTVIPSTTKYDESKFTGIYNEGFKQRSQYFVKNSASTTLGTDVLSTANVYGSGNTSLILGSVSNTVNTYLYTAFAVANVKLRDLIDVDKLPFLKNLNGYLTVNYNDVSINLTASSTAATNTVGSVSVVNNYGNSCPIQLNSSATTGIQMTSSTVDVATAGIIQVKASVDGTSTGALTGSAPIINNARFYVPYYTPTPDTADKFKTEKIFTISDYKLQILDSISSGQQVSANITDGLPNLTHLVIYPMLKLGSVSNPEKDLPFASSANLFSYLKDIQVYVANKPILQQVEKFDYNFFIEQMQSLGLNSINKTTTSGLIGEEDWVNNNRYYVFDLKRLGLDHSLVGKSQSVQLSFTNGTQYTMKVLCFLFFDTEYKCNPELCQITNN